MHRFIKLNEQFSQEIWNPDSTIFGGIVEQLEQELENTIQQFFYSDTILSLPIQDVLSTMESINNSFFTIYKSIGPEDETLLGNKSKCHYVALLWIQFWKHVFCTSTWFSSLKTLDHLQFLFESFFSAEHIHSIYFEQENYLEAFSELIDYLQFASFSTTNAIPSTCFTFQSTILSFQQGQIIKVIDLLFLRQSKDQMLIQPCISLVTNLLCIFPSFQQQLICYFETQEQCIGNCLFDLFVYFVEINENIAEQCLYCIHCMAHASTLLHQKIVKISNLQSTLQSILQHPMEYSSEIMQRAQDCMEILFY